MKTEYNLKTVPPGLMTGVVPQDGLPLVLKWSGPSAPPEIGTRVLVRVNRLGTGIVEHYFVEGEWLGIQVRLDDDPRWHQISCLGQWHAGLALVFGAEVENLA